MSAPDLPCDPFIRRFAVPLPAGEGPLAGLTCGAKDNYDIAGEVTGNGSPEWAAAHPQAAADAPLVTRLRALGVAILGKTQMDELAYSLMGVNARHGTPPNPAAPDRVPGGSSSGSAAATAAGLCALGLGSDTGGSVRLPASFCGLVGWRATHGSLPSGGLVPLAPSFDVPGFFTRDLATMARVAEALMPEAAVPGTPPRLAAPADLWAVAEPDTAAALAPALAALEAAFGSADRGVLADGPLEAWLDAFRHHQAHEIWRVHGAWVTEHRPAFGPGIRERFAWAAGISDATFEAAAAARVGIRKRLAERLAGGTVLVFPTAPAPAPLRSTPGAALETYRNAALTLLCPAGLAGLPQISLPVARVAGAPVGLSLVGAPGSDRALLEHARALAALPA